MIRTIMETSLFSKLERSRRIEKRVQVPSKAGASIVSDQNGNVDVASIVITIISVAEPKRKNKFTKTVLVKA